MNDKTIFENELLDYKFERAQKLAQNILTCNNEIILLKSDGTVWSLEKRLRAQKEKIPNKIWSGIKSIACSNNHLLGLRADGTVSACGDNNYDQCEVDDWEDVIDISAGNNFSAGLKSDGTVLIAGDLKDFDPSKFTNIKSIMAKNDGLVALNQAGNIIIAGEPIILHYYENNIILFSPEPNYERYWHSTSEIFKSINGNHLVVRLKNGKLSAYGLDLQKQCEVSDWENILDISAGMSHTLGLRNDGSVIATGNDDVDFLLENAEIDENYIAPAIPKFCKVEKWNNIIQIQAGLIGCSYALKDNGTVVYCFDKRYDSFVEMNPDSGFDDIIAIKHLWNIGLIEVRSDGTLWCDAFPLFGGAKMFQSYDSFDDEFIFAPRESDPEYNTRIKDTKRSYYDTFSDYKDSISTIGEKMATINRRISMKLCTYCGSKLKKGLFITRCSKCKKKKNYRMKEILNEID